MVDDDKEGFEENSDVATSTSSIVQLYMYDVSFGLMERYAKYVSDTDETTTKIDGVWHTSIIVFENEYFFSQKGIEIVRPESTLLGKPVKKLILGETNITKSRFDAHLEILSDTMFSKDSYDLFCNNCNTFTNHLSRFLTDKDIPKFATNLTSQFLRILNKIQTYLKETNT